MPSFLKDFFLINRCSYLFFLHCLTSVFEFCVILNFYFCNANKVLFDALFIPCNLVAEAVDKKTFYNSIYSSPTHFYFLGERTIGSVDVPIHLIPSQT